VDCNCCARRDWPRSSVVEVGACMTITSTAMQSAYLTVSRIILIANYSITVLNTHGSLIKPAKNWGCDKERRLPSRRFPATARSLLKNRSHLVWSPAFRRFPLGAA
jgi:hypothetical protein